MKASNFYDKLVKNNKLLTIVVSALVFLTAILSVPTGCFNINTGYEYAASYLADVATKHTNAGLATSLTVTPKSKEYGLVNTATEYYSIYNVFNDSNFPRFANTVNACKTSTVYATEIDNGVTNYSFLYAQNGFTNPKFGDHYIHEFYPLELLFPGYHHTPGFYSFLYVSVSQADKILASRGKEPSMENYESLIGTGLTLNINKKDYNYMIGNIYLETGTFYYELTNIMGDFFFSYCEYPDKCPKEATYFFNKEVYYNKYYLKHVMDQYSGDYYSYTIGEYNLKDGYKINYDEFYKHFQTSNKAVSAIFLVVALLVFFFVFWLLIDTQFANKLVRILCIIGPSLLGYLLFKYLAKFTNNIVFFTETTGILMLMATVILIVTFLVMYISTIVKKDKEVEVETNEK